MMVLLQEQLHLTLTDSKRHLRFAFHCPEGARGLRVEWRFAPSGGGDIRSMITLSLHDPRGVRGAGHRHGARHVVELGEHFATPGYFPDPLPPGRWEVALHTHLVAADTEGELRVTLLSDSPSGGESALPAAPLSAPPKESGAWMMGDLHCHTDHSDAAWTAHDLARAAEARGLRFLALTDHNTTSGREVLRRAAPHLLHLPGLELTTYYGHAVALGVAAHLDWTALQPHQGTRALAERVAEEGGVFTIAHPLAVGDPICTGCTWTYFDFRPEHASHLEVWNGPWHAAHNERALAHWYALLAQGRRVLATAGTDAHGPAYQDGHGFTCTPATSDAAQLLQQLREGHTYLSRAANLDLTVETNGTRATLGGKLPAGVWTASLRWAELPAGSVLYSVTDGERRAHSLSAKGELRLDLRVARWLNFEVLQGDGQLHTLTNPVFATASS